MLLDGIAELCDALVESGSIAEGQSLQGAVDALFDKPTRYKTLGEAWDAGDRAAQYEAGYSYGLGLRARLDELWGIKLAVLEGRKS
jgi:hypothetical protein